MGYAIVGKRNFFHSIVYGKNISDKFDWHVCYVTTANAQFAHNCRVHSANKYIRGIKRKSYIYGDIFAFTNKRKRQVDDKIIKTIEIKIKQNFAIENDVFVYACRLDRIILLQK